MISGPPGIGKTTTVRLVCKSYGYQLIENNASDVRNKAAVQTQLGDLKNNQLLKFGEKELSANEKFVILMDEVDGMSAGDRGGNAALIQVIKKTKIPIICICNDRSSNKIKSLLNYCYEVIFQKPTKQ